MATGSGQTLTAVTQAYRLIKFATPSGIGLTATPNKATLGFFNRNLVTSEGSVGRFSNQ